jgi:hypothetical protein
VEVHVEVDTPESETWAPLVSLNFTDCQISGEHLKVIAPSQVAGTASQRNANWRCGTGDSKDVRLPETPRSLGHKCDAERRQSTPPIVACHEGNLRRTRELKAASGSRRCFPDKHLKIDCCRITKGTLCLTMPVCFGESYLSLSFANSIGCSEQPVQCLGELQRHRSHQNGLSRSSCHQSKTFWTVLCNHIASIVPSAVMITKDATHPCQSFRSAKGIAITRDASALRKTTKLRDTRGSDRRGITPAYQP